jgi:hypothetical protein
MRPRLWPLLLLALLTTDCDVLLSPRTTHFAMHDGALDVFARNDTLLVAARDSGLLALDISRPISPREMWRADIGRVCNCVLAVGSAAFVGTDSGVLCYGLTVGDRTWLRCGGTSQAVCGLAADSLRLYAATDDGVTVYDLDSREMVRFVALAGLPRGLARHDSRLFVALRDWGVCLLHLLPGDSFSLDTLRLGNHARSEGVTVSAAGYCVVSQADSGFSLYYTPFPDTVRFVAGGGGGFAAYSAALTDDTAEVSIYTADSSEVRLNRLVKRPGSLFFSDEGDFGQFAGFSRRICLGGNGYAYTASGDAGMYIIRE